MDNGLWTFGHVEFGEPEGPIQRRTCTVPPTWWYRAHEHRAVPPSLAQPSPALPAVSPSPSQSVWPSAWREARGPQLRAALVLERTPRRAIVFRWRAGMPGVPHSGTAVTFPHVIWPADGIEAGAFPPSRGTNKSREPTMSSLIAQYFLNHRLDLDEIQWQMEEFASQGYHGVYAHARPGMLTPYMSDEWWQALDQIVDMCRRLGLEFWIWDEDYYPSGLCGGRVVWADPGLVARQLQFTVASAEGRQLDVDFAPGLLLKAYAMEVMDDGTLGQPVDVTRFCGTRRQRWRSRQVVHRAYSPLINQVGHPHWRTGFDDNRFALAWQAPRPARYTVCAALVQNQTGHHPDLLRPEGIRQFLELSYQPYADRYGHEMGELIQGAFTDEPSPGCDCFPWTASFPQAFEADHGYDILDYLPHLALDLDDRTALVRHHYRLTQHRLQKACYIDQVGHWCRDHNIRFAGHLTRTEWFSLVAAWWPNELRCYQSMDIPSCDPLGASEGWSDAAAYHSGCKVASSAAHLFGKEQAGSDCLAVIGDEASLRDLKYHLDYQMALGINHFTVHGLSYSIDGPRKDEVPPSIFYQHTQWKHMSVLMDHVTRTAAELTGGRHLCELAVLYPSTSLACQIRPDIDWRSLPDEAQIHALSEQLLSHQRDFDFIDEVTLQECIDEHGDIRTPEPYATVLLPYSRFIDARSADALLRFARNGGRVTAVGCMPQALADDLDQPLRDWADDSVELVPELGPDTLASLPGADVQGAGARDLLLLRREKQREPRLFAFNRRESTFSGTIDGQQVTVAPRSSILLRASGPDSDIPSLAPNAETVDLPNGWRVTFEPNQLPLAFWHASGAGGDAPEGFVAGPGFDLMRRENDPMGEGEGGVRYDCRLMLTGEVADARIVLEDSTVSGKWQLYVNGVPIGDWARAVVFDCRNLQAAVGHALRGGSTPALNVVSVVATGAGRGLHEVPYLYGSFVCEYRYGHLSFPFLEGTPPERQLDALLPWNALGYPTFSGAATYTRTLDLAEAGDYVLDLGRVEDCAAVTVDGNPVAVLPWEPYRCMLYGLESGAHELQVEVTNPPANRNRAAGLTAGLLGPVKLQELT